MAKEGLTPMMKQFYDLKAKHPDAIMLFRCGDFYETYCEDAVVASEILGITLTKRNNGGKHGEPVEMAGFPYHAPFFPCYASKKKSGACNCLHFYFHYDTIERSFM